MKHWRGRIFYHLPKFRGDATFKTRVFRIAYNENVTFIRRRKPNDSLDVFNEAAVHDSEKVDLAVDWSFNGMLACLSLEGRSILALRLISDLDFPETANITGNGPSAVKMRYKRALEKLRPLLEKSE